MGSHRSPALSVLVAAPGDHRKAPTPHRGSEGQGPRQPRRSEPGLAPPARAGPRPCISSRPQSGAEATPFLAPMTCPLLSPRSSAFICPRAGCTLPVVRPPEPHSPLSGSPASQAAAGTRGGSPLAPATDTYTATAPRRRQPRARGDGRESHREVPVHAPCVTCGVGLRHSVKKGVNKQVNMYNIKG